jgi:hypothetical protein
VVFSGGSVHETECIKDGPPFQVGGQTFAPQPNVGSCGNACVPTPSLSVTPSVTTSVTPSVTPTRSITPTQTPTPTPTCPGVTLDCYQYFLDNSCGGTQQTWSYVECENGTTQSQIVPAGQSFYSPCSRTLPTLTSGPACTVPEPDLNPCGSYCAPGSPSATPSVTPTPSGPPNG